MISIIVPIYNAEAYLPACLDSLLAQTVQDLQIILVDDGSTDSGQAIAQRYAVQEPRIKLYQQPHAGQSAARNLGLQHAEGEYIAFVDADDMLESDWCERHLAAIDGVDYVQSGYKRIQINHQQTAVIHRKTPLHPYRFTSPCMRLYRRETIAGLNFPEGMIYEDVLFSVDLWLRGARCRILDDTGYRYTLNPHSTTSQPHPEARRTLIQTLKERKKGASFKGRMIINYTILRLRIHFMI